MTTKINVPNDYFHPEELLALPIKRAAYSDRTAWLMAKLSNLAYVLFEQGEKDQLEATLKTASFRLVATFSGQSTQAYLAEGQYFNVLAFRGTEKNTADIKADLNIHVYRTKQGRLHRGFMNAYSEVEADIIDSLKHLNNNPLYVTGHSLGGALASIATSLLATDKIAACYTFGSPRVGNEEFDANLKIPVYRVVNATDAVTRMPLLLMGYTHVGDLRYLTTKNELLRNVSMFRAFWIFLTSILRDVASPGNDHRLQNYIDKLAIIAKKRNTDLLQ